MKTGTYKINFGQEFNQLLEQENGSKLLQEYYQSSMESQKRESVLPDFHWSSVYSHPYLPRINAPIISFFLVNTNPFPSS